MPAAVGGERLANGCYSSTIHKPEDLPEDLKKQSKLLQSRGEESLYWPNCPEVSFMVCSACLSCATNDVSIALQAKI